jgi:hypothetical protein
MDQVTKDRLKRQLQDIEYRLKETYRVDGDVDKLFYYDKLSYILSIFPDIVVNDGVPYTGATSDVDLGTHKLTLNRQQFTPQSAPAYSEGLVWYDSDQESLAFYNDSSLSPVFIGENIVLKVYNNTGSTIAKGAAVYIQSGGAFTYPNVALAKADNPATAAVIGLMNASTPTGSFGYVTSAGVITGVNTGAIAEGTVLYLSPYSAGQLMSTVPPTGYVIQVGVVAHSNSPNGTIYTKQTTPLAISAAIVVGTLAINQGGTGATTASSALSNLGGVPSSRTLTINGTTFDLTANRSWTITAATPTLDQVTTAGNITTNAITAGGFVVSTGGNSTNWNTAFGWGNHATAGYLLASAGWSGNIFIPMNLPGQQNITVNNGQITNVS